MQQRNSEPLMILLATGIFLLLLAGGVMHVFPGKKPERAGEVIIPAKITKAEVPVDGVNSKVTEDELAANLDPKVAK